VFAGGRSAHSKTCSVYARPSLTGVSRSTVIAGRKVGGAVARNRAKRRLRAALQRTGWREGYDVVVVARSRCLCLSFAELEATLGEQIRRSVNSCAEHSG
jgi:ribonuclease P protein component